MTTRRKLLAGAASLMGCGALGREEPIKMVGLFSPNRYSDFPICVPTTPKLTQELLDQMYQRLIRDGNGSDEPRYNFMNGQWHKVEVEEVVV